MSRDAGTGSSTRVRAWLAGLVLAGCSDPVGHLRDSIPPSAASGDGTDAGSPPALTFDPESTPDEVARVARLLVRLPDTMQPNEVLLFDGALSATEQRAIQRGTLTAALAARRVEVLAWLHPGDPTLLVVAPLRVLDGDRTYALALAGLSWTGSFHVRSSADAPLLARVWPDPGQVGTSVIWCGEDTLAPVQKAVAFEPAGQMGMVARGVGAPFDVPRCVRWDAAASLLGETALVAPPVLALSDGSSVALDPALIVTTTAPPPPVAPVACAGEEVALSLGCARADDDRLVLRPPPQPLLWSIETPSGVLLRRSTGGRFVVRPLPPDSEVPLRAAAVDTAGTTYASDAVMRTMPAHAHVVINEVFANPAGPEPAEEWVELFNDGATGADLDGYRLEDGTGASTLPAVTLEPGAFALCVSHDWLADDGVDPVPPPDTVVVRLPALGANGLANSGEPLTLFDRQGAPFSRFPAVAAKSGVSIARAQPDALDDDLSAFRPDPNGSATPGRSNP